MTDRLVDLANWVLLGSVEALDAVTGQGAPTARRLNFGDAASVVHDHCCDDPGIDHDTGLPLVGGQLVVSVGTIYPSVRFPTPDQRPRAKGGPWAVPFTVELVRCASSGDRQGFVPYDVAQAESEDLLEAGRLLGCWFRRRFGNVEDGIISGIDSSTEGGCRSVRLRMTIAMR